MTARPTTIPAEDGISLEARWDAPPAPGRTAILCHPHPLYGGDMRAPLLRTLTACLVEAGCAVLRFNFRGVGGSTGSWSGGRGEVADLAAAVRAADTAFPGVPLGLAGWSFGALIALAWQAATAGRQPLAGIAPVTRAGLGPALPRPESLAPARRLFLVGSRDRFTEPPALQAYAGAIGAELQIFPGSDHFFFGRERRVGDAIAAHLAEAEAG